MVRYIGIDYGHKRVGVALSDGEGGFAFPHAVWTQKEALEKIVALVAERGVGAVVIGQSHDLAGVANPIQQKIDDFILKLKEKITIPIHSEPEFYTSAEAEHIQGKTASHDASAAALILKSYFDKQQNQ